MMNKNEEKRAGLFCWKLSYIREIRTPKSIIKKVFPCAPIIGVYPSIKVSAYIVPENNHGKPVNKYDLIISITTLEMGRGKKARFWGLDNLRKLFSRSKNPE